MRIVLVINSSGVDFIQKMRFEPRFDRDDGGSY
jgi:hypothetical protein